MSEPSEADAEKEYLGAKARLKMGRNDRCPCGSGKKYKKCCLEKDEVIVLRMRLAQQVLERALPDARRGSGGQEIDGLETADEERVPSEDEVQLEEAWKEYEAVKVPSTAGLDRLLDALLKAPPELTMWGDVLHLFARDGHADLARVFRRIAAEVPPTKESALSFFYWAAAEEFCKAGMIELLPEVAAGFETLDFESYDVDSLLHLKAYLLAAGFEREALKLTEHFLPIVRGDEELMPWVVPNICFGIYQLRVGMALRDNDRSVKSAEEIAGELRRDLEEEIDEALALRAAQTIQLRQETREWTRSDFELVEADINTSAQAMEQSFRLHATLIRVAREAWQADKVPPGCAFQGLMEVLAGVHGSGKKGKKKQEGRPSLLDYLRPAGLERRVAESAKGLLGVDVPQARLLLQAHEVLANFALRHGLMSSAEGEASKKEVGRLRQKLGWG